jgi:hypothetical protein
MVTPGAESDDSLLADLRTIAAAADPVPDHVDELARGALATRHLDQLARRLADSAESPGLLTRDEPGRTRLLSFGTDAVTIELQVSDEGASLRLRGLVRGASGPVTLEVRGGAAREADVDEAGFFSMPAPSPALLRLRLQGTTTEWFDV